MLEPTPEMYFVIVLYQIAEPITKIINTYYLRLKWFQWYSRIFTPALAAFFHRKHKIAIQMLLVNFMKKII